MNNTITPITPTPPSPKSSSNTVFILAFVAIIGALTYGVYHFSSEYFDGAESGVTKIAALTETGTATGRIATDEERTVAFTSLFDTLADIGESVAPMAMGMAQGGMPGGFPGADLGQTPPDMGGDTNNFPDSADMAANNMPNDEQMPTTAEESGMGDNTDGGNTVNDASVVEGETATVTQLRTESAYLSFGNPSLGLGATVITDITSEDANGSISHTYDYQTMAQSEFKDAKLTKAELAKLAQLNIDLDINNGESISGDDSQIVQKLVKLVYYGKRLDKAASIAVLVESLHPSIRQALAQNADLAVESAAPEHTQLAAVEPAQPAPADEIANALKGVEVEASNALANAGALANPSDADDRFADARDAANSGNFAKALRLWLPLAESGHAASQTAVGRLYARGDGVQQNLQEARHWFELAARQGETKAQLNLGKMYLRGDGGPKDQNKAKQYLALAAQAGNDEADSLLKSFGKGIR